MIGWRKKDRQRISRNDDVTSRQWGCDAKVTFNGQHHVD